MGQKRRRPREALPASEASAPPETPPPGPPRDRSNICDIRCPVCEVEGRTSVVGGIVYGPGVYFRVVLADEGRPGDVELRCPACQTSYCVRACQIAE